MTLVAPVDFKALPGAQIKDAPASFYTGTDWNPSLSAGTDYWLRVAGGRGSGTLFVTGGRHVGIIGTHLSIGHNGGPNIYVAGGDTGGIVWCEGVLIDCSSGFESDAIRTHNVGAQRGDTRILKLKYCRFVNMRGQSNQGVTTVAVGGAALNSATVNVGSTSSFPPGPHWFVCPDDTIVTYTGTTGTSFTGCSSHPALSSGNQLLGTDDWGNPTAATHADSTQLAGGIMEFWAEDCTFASRYANMQLQHEQSEQGSYLTVTGATASPFGAGIARYTFSANHGRSVGDWMQMGNGVQAGGSNIQPSSPNGGWNGTYQVVNVPSPSALDVRFGTKAIPGSFTSNGTAKLSTFGYDVGPISLHRVNMFGQLNPQCKGGANGQTPTSTINFWRWGGRPDYKGFEDMTDLASAGLGGTVNLDEVYIDPYQALNDIPNMCNPGSALSVYSDARMRIRNSSPNRIMDYPNNPLVIGQALEGRPPNGDFCPVGVAGLAYPGRVVAGHR